MAHAMVQENRALLSPRTNKQRKAVMVVGAVVIALAIGMVVGVGAVKFNQSESRAAVPEMAVSVGPVSIAGSPEDIAREVEGAAKAFRFVVGMKAAQLQQETPEMQSFNQWGREVSKGLKGTERDYVLLGGRKADFRRRTVVLLLRELPRDEQEILYDWFGSMGIEESHEASSAAALEQVYLHNPDHPAAQQIKALVDHCRENNLFI